MSRENNNTNISKNTSKRFSLFFYILAAVTVGWFILITYLSHQSDTSSNDNSLKLTTGLIVMSETIEGTRDDKLEEDLTYSGTFNLILRDIAHVGAFGGLSFLVLLTLFVGKLKLWPGIVFSVFWSIADEMSKLLFPGRHAELRDVGLNVIGAVAGITAVYIIIIIIKQIRKQRIKAGGLAGNSGIGTDNAD